jgi:ComF family protein
MATGRASWSKLIEALKRNNWLRFNHFASLLPARCALCAVPVTTGLLCAACTDDLPWRAHTALRMSGLRRCHASFRYEFPVVEFIGRGKFAGDAGLMTLLGQLMAARPPVTLGEVDCLCAIPLPYWRGVRRGYNQALEIGRPIARALGLPVFDALQRSGGLPTQRSLSRKGRLRNLAGAFVAGPAVAGQRILLIDDVTTTGSTLRQATRALHAAGATAVIAWAAAAVD